MKFAGKLSQVGLIMALAVAGAQAGFAQQLGGGPREYVKYPGTATIVRVEKVPTAGPGERAKAEEGYAVWFTFQPKGVVKEELGKNYLQRHKEHQLTLMNGWLPGPKYLQKYNIKKDAQMPATLSVLVRGTTTPVMIELDGVSRADYFEAAPSP